MLNDKRNNNNNNIVNYTMMTSSVSYIVNSSITTELSSAHQSVQLIDEQSIDIETHLGIMKCKIFGPIHGIPIITVHGMNIALVNEWSYIARYLSTRGYRIFMLNFHSNNRLKPSSLHNMDFNRIISDIITKYIEVEEDSTDDEKKKKKKRKKLVILMGKSWGGQSIASYSSMSEYTELIKKIVLIAPGIPKNNKNIIFELSKIQLPIFLGWANDDMIMSNNVVDVWLHAFEADSVNQEHHHHHQQQQMWLHTYNVESGGHLIFDEYAQPIEQFLSIP